MNDLERELARIVLEAAERDKTVLLHAHFNVRMFFAAMVKLLVEEENKEVGDDRGVC